ncbi:MAG: ribosome maturation factor RimP [Lachnospiraceae bacterium]|nr:ribosome maturation factor RimP [Lachnospiraceae bacterium]MBQ1399140.1 ribosome maturation factor RimP [Lachnospiraceae bacterium]MBQ1514777.1 ribosome maturation factor RimP [Lachnospiraceae bacterium]MBQ3399907.1 ribosome maturation factor RimP [Lachnospiraceae bacterium]MBQ4308373.1 ribosome maturation factor RimP [Lachnospiraceae bacterium]
MSKRTDIEARTEKLLEPIMEENRFEMVDVEYVKEGGNYYLRAYIDKENGITIDDCELVSRALEAKLDEEDFIDDAYILEISSPGLGRALKKDRDLQRSIGKEVDVKLFSAVDGQKALTGILAAWNDTEITLDLEGEETVLKRDNIAQIRLSFTF